MRSGQSTRQNFPDTRSNAESLTIDWSAQKGLIEIQGKDTVERFRYVSVNYEQKAIDQNKSINAF